MCFIVWLKAPGQAQTKPLSIPPLPFMGLHARPRDHYLKHCLQLIFKAASNQPKATRLGFQAVTNAEIWDIWWGRFGRELTKWSSFLGQSRLLWVMSWDMKTWGCSIWMSVFLYKCYLSVEAGEAGVGWGQMEGESVQMPARSKAFLAVSSSRSLLHSFGA